VVLEGEAARKMIVRGHQQACWREDIGKFVYHRYVIHDVQEQFTSRYEVSRVYNCFHYRDDARIEAPLVQCLGQKKDSK